MPYSKWYDVNPAIKGIRPRVSLGQANTIAAWADEMEDDGVENAWATAIALFKKSYSAKGGKWAKTETSELDFEYELGDDIDGIYDFQTGTFVGEVDEE